MIPRDSLTVITGPFGIRQVVAGVRHDLRRGAAAVRRVAVGVRAAVPGADGQARRRLDRGALAGDLDRPEDDLAQPALDGRDRDRDLRLPAAAVGADRAAALPHLRAADQRPVGRADHRPGDGAGRGDAVHGAGADRPRAQGRVRQAARGAADRGVHAGEDRRRAGPAGGAAGARQALQARHRDRRRPARHEERSAQAAGRLDRDGGGAGRRSGGDRDGPARRLREGRDADLQREVRVPGPRAVAGRARATDLQLQLAARRLSSLHRASARRWRSTPNWSSRTRTQPGRGRDRAMGGERVGLLRAADPGDRRSLRGRSGDAVERAAGGVARVLPVRLGRRPDPVAYRNRFGRRAHVLDPVRGDCPEPRAALQGDRVSTSRARRSRST